MPLLVKGSSLLSRSFKTITSCVGNKHIKNKQWNFPKYWFYGNYRSSEDTSRYEEAPNLSFPFPYLIEFLLFPTSSQDVKIYELIKTIWYRFPKSPDPKNVLKAQNQMKVFKLCRKVKSNHNQSWTWNSGRWMTGMFSPEVTDQSSFF